MAFPRILCIGVVALSSGRALAVSPIVTGTDTGPAAHVKAFTGTAPTETASFLPYTGFTGGVRVAVGDVNGDTVPDIVTGAGPGGGPHVKVFSGSNGAELQSFFAYDAAFSGGVFVAAGDVTGDKHADLFTGSGSLSSHVKVFNGVSQAEVQSFLAFPGFTGGVRVAAGDINGDGRADIIAGMGSGGGDVKAFDGVSLAPLHSFSPYGSFTGGVFVASGDVTGDGHADIITGTDAAIGGASLVRLFDGVSLQQLRSFTPFDAFSGGVRVAVGDVNGDGRADIITGTGPGAAHVKVFDAVTNDPIRSFLPYSAFTGGIFVAGETPVPEPTSAACVIILTGGALMSRRNRRTN
jgi:hypothetical protein